MRKRPVQTITFDKFHSARRAASGPPESHESMFDRIFTALAHMTGLTRKARASLVRQLEASDAEVAGRVQHLHRLLNTVVDGGWMGLWTSVRVCAGAV